MTDSNPLLQKKKKPKNNPPQVICTDDFTETQQIHIFPISHLSHNSVFKIMHHSLSHHVHSQAPKRHPAPLLIRPQIIQHLLICSSEPSPWTLGEWGDVEKRRAEASSWPAEEDSEEDSQTSVIMKNWRWWASKCRWEMDDFNVAGARVQMTRLIKNVK